MNVSQKRLFIPLGEEVDYDRFKTVEEVFELLPASSRLTKMRAFPRSTMRSSEKKFIRRTVIYFKQIKPLARDGDT